jgi:hypothetical protein
MTAHAPQSAVDLLDQEIASQNLLIPPPEDHTAWLTRYIFNPFRSRPLEPIYQGYFGLTAFRQGIIQPIRAVNKPEPHYQSIKSFEDNDLTPQGAGVSEMKIDRRSPLKIVNALLREYRIYRGYETGVAEIACLLGVDDPALIRRLQVHFLPEVYDTASAQVTQLEDAYAGANDSVFNKVGDALLASTYTAVQWAEWYYGDLLEQIESFGQGMPGKGRLSPLDKQVCAWLELEEPRIQTKLTTKGQPHGPAQIDVGAIVSQAVTAAVTAVQQMNQPVVAIEPVAAPEPKKAKPRVPTGQSEPLTDEPVK